MAGAGLSRWVMLYFTTALTAFLLAQAAIVAGLAYPTLPLGAPASLAMVHILTIGWLTILILGALQQFVPMITGHAAANGVTALLPLIAIGVGLAGMVLGFVSLAGSLPAILVAALPIGGLLILVSLLASVISLAWPLWQIRPIGLAAAFVSTGLSFLLATGALGVVFTGILAFPATFPWGQVLGPGLAAHVAGGIVGWFTLTAIGVSYRLLPMFLPAPEDRGQLGRAIFALTAGGLTIAWLANLALHGAPRLQMSAIVVGGASTVLGLMLYLADVAHLYRARRRRVLELHSAAAIAAFDSLGIGVALLVVSSLVGRLEGILIPALYLLVFGWLSGLALAQLYKLVPFLTWLQRYSHLLGRAPVPGMDQFVNEARAAPWFVAYFAAIAIGTVCGLLGLPSLWRMAVAGHLVATLLIAHELWRARYEMPAHVTTSAVEAEFGQQHTQQGA